MSEHSFGEASEFTNKTPQGYGNGIGKVKRLQEF